VWDYHAAMSLEPCLSCGRHIRVGEGTCPFCGANERQGSISSVGQAAAVAACIGLALSVCGCYGPPPPQKGSGPMIDQPLTAPAAQAQAPAEQQPVEQQPGQQFAKPPEQQQAR